MEDIKSVTSFKVGGEFFCVATHSVRHILEDEVPTRVPLTKPFVRGIINNHGTMIPEVDFRALLEIEADDTLTERCIVVVGIEADGKEELVGFRVDEMDDVFEYEDADFVAETVIDVVPEVQRAVAGTIRREGKFVYLLRVADLAEALL